MSNKFLTYCLMPFLVGCNLNAGSVKREAAGEKRDTTSTMHKELGRIDSLRRAKLDKDAIRILSMYKDLDTTVTYYYMDTAACKNWELRQIDILRVLKLSEPISGTEWDLSYEVFPCSYKGEFVMAEKRGEYEVNAGSFVALTFRDTTIYLGYEHRDRLFLSQPQ